MQSAVRRDTRGELDVGMARGMERRVFGARHGLSSGESGKPDQHPARTQMAVLIVTAIGTDGIVSLLQYGTKCSVFFLPIVLEVVMLPRLIACCSKCPYVILPDSLLRKLHLYTVDPRWVKLVRPANTDKCNSTKTSWFSVTSVLF